MRWNPLRALANALLPWADLPETPPDLPDPLPRPPGQRVELVPAPEEAVPIPPPPGPSPILLTDEKKLLDWFCERQCCPDCGSTAFLEGPRGGLAQNVACAQCGSRYNLAFPFLVERISDHHWEHQPQLQGAP